MLKAKCICIDDSDRPDEIKIKNWVVKGTPYHITHIWFMTIQGIQGVDLQEISTCNDFYPSYKLSRFAFTIEGYYELIALIKECSEFNDPEIKKLLEELKIVETQAV